MNNLDEKTYHLINQYLKGELKGRAMDEFKVRLKDEAFARQVAEQSAIIDALKQVRKEELKALFKQETKTRYIQNQWGNKWTYASAAIVILFVSTFFIMKFFVPNKDRHLATEELQDSADSTIANELPETEIDTQLLAIEDATPPNPMALEETTETIDTLLVPSIEIVEDEMDEDMDGVISTVEEEVTEANEPEQVDEIVVKSDKKIASKRYKVPQYSPTFAEQTQATRSKDTAGELLDSQVVNAGASDAVEEIKTVNLNVEFWSSPVNFKGYKYSKDGLQLFEIAPTQTLTFKFLDQRLYLKLGNSFYFLEKNNEFNKFVAVSNQTLLNVLNE
ncbi:MAG: hypothetical protein JXR19_00055 [Bacteroidia bacterium]